MILASDAKNSSYSACRETRAHSFRRTVVILGSRLLFYKPSIGQAAKRWYQIRRVIG